MRDINLISRRSQFFNECAGQILIDLSFGNSRRFICRSRVITDAVSGVDDNDLLLRADCSIADKKQTEKYSDNNNGR